MTRDIADGTLIDDRYKVISRVGSGGMADVYCAEDLQLGRKVALKLLHRRFSEDEEFVERFRLEASSAAGLQHPHVVSVFDRGEWDGTYYIAMEYLDGRTLKEIVKDDAPLEPLRAVDLITQVLRAAQFAHKRGIIHRDLKPHNVIVDADDRATVTDFGIARAGASEMTQTGSIMGTAQYLSPEQAQGHAVSAASDLYSVGVVLYELLTAKVPFDGDSAVTIALKHVTETPVLPSTLNPEVPQELDAVVMRALGKNPDERFTSASEFISALDAVRQLLVGVPAGESTSQFIPPSLADFDPAETGQIDAVEVDEEEYVERRKWPWIAALLVVILAGLAALGYFLTRPNEHTVPDVVGQDLASALAVLRNEDFEVSVQRVVNPAPRDRVLRQDPQAQAPADRASTVTLTVSDGPGDATVPDVAGLPLKKARKVLQDEGFSVRVKIVNSAIVKSGRAIRTSPAVGSQIDKDSQITLFISKGPEQVTVPDVRGKSQESAESRLTGLGLKVDVTEVVSDQDPKTVLTQTPAPESEVDKGETVSLTVAKESKDVPVPSVIGDTQGEAASALSALGLAVSFVYKDVSDANQDGVVLRQNPSSGKPVKKGAKVNLTIGRQKKTPTSTSTGPTTPTTTPTTP